MDENNKTYKKFNLEEIIKTLNSVTVTLKESPEKALKELREVGIKIDTQIPYHDGHILRVAEYSMAIAEEIGLSEEKKVILEVAALLHDFGKLGIDEDILLLPRKLTELEKKEVDMHVIRGYYLLAGFNELFEALNGVKSHHEHFNGSGYPQGLKKDEIPLIARIIAVADAYDAMVSKRPYRDALTKEEAIRELKANAGTQFDPAVVRIFIKYITTKRQDIQGAPPENPQ